MFSQDNFLSRGQQSSQIGFQMEKGCLQWTELACLNN